MGSERRYFSLQGLTLGAVVAGLVSTAVWAGLSALLHHDTGTNSSGADTSVSHAVDAASQPSTTSSPIVSSATTVPISVAATTPATDPAGPTPTLPASPVTAPPTTQLVPTTEPVDCSNPIAARRVWVGPAIVTGLLNLYVEYCDPSAKDFYVYRWCEGSDGSTMAEQSPLFIDGVDRSSEHSYGPFLLQQMAIYSSGSSVPSNGLVVGVTYRCFVRSEPEMGGTGGSARSSDSFTPSEAMPGY